MDDRTHVMSRTAAELRERSGRREQNKVENRTALLKASNGKMTWSRSTE